MRNRWALIIIPLLVALVNGWAMPTAAAGPQPYRQVVFFGDSLSDPGNHYTAFGTIARQPFVPIPDDSYAVGGHHFSNGATWAEQLAAALHLPNSGAPALRAPGVSTNYAVGRARARADSPVFSAFDLTTQVSQFLSDFGGSAPSDALYVIWIGNNDVGEALAVLAADPAGGLPIATAIIGMALDAVADNIVTLYGAGARNFLVPDVMNLAFTPVVAAAGPAAQYVAGLLAGGYNGALAGGLAFLGGVLTGSHFVGLDVNAVLGYLVTTPGTGLTNVHDPCLRFFVVANAICAAPGGYLFWDGIHPTTAGHGFMAQAALMVLTAP
jgi:phospholipase/lecithinase/hemolysin